jgi:hypothetical protein
MTSADPTDPPSPAVQAEVTASGVHAVAVNAGAGARQWRNALGDQCVA